MAVFQRAKIKQARRIVVKVGTKILCGNKGQFNLQRMESLVEDLAALWDEGLDVIVVSSGAIGAGVGRLGLARRPQNHSRKAGSSSCWSGNSDAAL